MSKSFSSSFPNSLFKKCSVSLILGLEFSALMLLLGNGGNVPWLPPVVVFSVIGFFLVSSFLFPFIWHFLERKKTINSEKIYDVLYGVIRYCLAFNLASFGWKKFYGLQFVVPEEVSSMPMKQQTGEWLTWFYFGYSHTYGILIALIQIIGGSLLLFRRTLLTGALLLFPVLFNLTLINIFYEMNAGALLQSVLLTIGVLFFILLDYKRLVAFFFETESFLPSGYLNGFVKNCIRFSALVLSLLFTIYLTSLIR